ncbi:hypothetical protein [Nocardioides solisilvae]|uniref:hypothetical protein n=1 Tax=Nocardioides solisilvae TaxID=1542435 RepID=UPI000D7486A9|nr:hypothetical protein [Nocardioides solisilvae]
MVDADTDTDLALVVADLRRDGVHVDPRADDWIPPAQLDAIVRTLREADVPVHLVLLEPSDDGRGLSAGEDLLVRVHDAGGPDGLYVGVNEVWSGSGEEVAGAPTLADGRAVDVALRQWGEVDGSTDLTRAVETVLREGRVQADGAGAPYAPGDGLLRIAEALADGSFDALTAEAEEAGDVAHEQWRAEREAQQQEEQEEEQGTATGQESTPGPAAPAGDGWGTGELVGLGVGLAVLAAVVGLVARGRARRRTTTTFVLPESVLERVQAAGDAELVRRARRDVLALGEELDAAEMTGSADRAWAAALDHYELAGRLLPASAGPGDVDPLDAVGAVVLAGRGREALAAARAGRPFVPSTPCFLNPLHGRASGDRTLEHDGRTLRAPVCLACRRDLGAGRRPDVLDVVVRGTPRHYFQTDREPWASTGYGALDPDLVGRLQGRA